jgi:hypothetical protein
MDPKEHNSRCWQWVRASKIVVITNSCESVKSVIRNDNSVGYSASFIKTPNKTTSIPIAAKTAAEWLISDDHTTNSAGEPINLEFWSDLRNCSGRSAEPVCPNISLWPVGPKTSKTNLSFQEQVPAVPRTINQQPNPTYFKVTRNPKRNPGTILSDRKTPWKQGDQRNPWRNPWNSKNAK